MRNLAAAFAALILLSTAAPAVAQQTTKQQDIRTLIEMTGAANIATQMVNGMMPQMRQMILKLRPDISKKNLDILLGEFTQVFAKSAPKLVDTMVPLYDQRFSQQEIRDIIAFYKTPTGKKVLTELPGLMAEGMQLGQKWGQAVAQIAVKRVQDRMRELGI